VRQRGDGPSLLFTAALAIVDGAVVGATLPASWHLTRIVLAIVGPALLAAAATAPRYRLGRLVAHGLIAVTGIALAAGVALALRDSSGTRYPHLFLENILWNGSGAFFLGMVGLALATLPLAAAQSGFWRYAARDQLRLLAAVVAVGLLTYVWLPTTKNQGILIALAITGAVGGLLAGSWWALGLLPLSMLAGFWLWQTRHPPEYPPHEPLTAAGLAIIWAICCGAVSAGAALGTLLATLAESTLSRGRRRLVRLR
jgi:hypothetical protein